MVRNKETTLQEITAAARARAGRKETSGNLWIAFTGPAGSGKKLTAKMLAKELGVGLLRVDLDRVISQYIGETEKNLRQLFKRAAARQAILFFDEADSLFGKRSEVKDAHDRYANIGIDYLIQRIESYGGIAVLATSKKANLDQAFLRRCTFVMACR